MLLRASQVRVNFGRVASNRGIRQVHAEAQLKNLGLKLPTISSSKTTFVNFLVVDNMAYLAGHLPQPAEGPLMVGKVGKDWTVEDGYKASKVCGLNLLATLKHNLGDLDKVKRVVKLTGFVNCIDCFTQQPAVMNGCSELMTKVFGISKGAHVRSALGTNSLPFGVGVEVEAVVELEEGHGIGQPNDSDASSVEEKSA